MPGLARISSVFSGVTVTSSAAVTPWHTARTNTTTRAVGRSMTSPASDHDRPDREHGAKRGDRSSGDGAVAHRGRGRAVHGANAIVVSPVRADAQVIETGRPRARHSDDGIRS